MAQIRFSAMSNLSRIIAVLAFACAVAGVRPANAQDPAAPAAAPPAAGAKQWKEIAIPEELSKRSSPERAKISRELPDIMSGRTPLDDNAKQVMEAYFVRILIAQMTHVDTLPALTENRQELRKRWIRSPFAPENVHAYLNELIFQNMSKIARDDGFHPAVRVNAMYMIADLNNKEASAAGGAMTPAEPLTTALTARGGLLDVAGDATVHPAVRAMALYGVQRHADANLPAANQAAVQAGMANILKEKLTGPAATQTAWLKIRAAGVLEKIGVAVPAAAGELGTIIADETQPVAVRCAAARSLGAQKGLAAGMIQLSDVVAGLGNLQLDLCRAELDRAVYDQDTVSARQIHYRTSAVKAALGDGGAGGVTILVPAGDAQKALLDGIAANVAAVLALVPDENADPTEQLKIKADELEKLLADNNVLKSQPRATAAPAETPATTTPAADTTTPAAADAAATTTN